MLLPGDEVLFGGLQVEVGVEKDVKGDVPERVLVLRTVPETFGALDNCVLQHLKGGVVLGLDAFLYSHIDPFAVPCSDILELSDNASHPDCFYSGCLRSPYSINYRLRRTLDRRKPIVPGTELSDSLVLKYRVLHHRISRPRTLSRLYQAHLVLLSRSQESHSDRALLGQ